MTADLPEKDPYNVQATREYFEIPALSGFSSWKAAVCDQIA
jgi:hypothetical protein